MSENMLSMLEPDKWTTGQMDRIATGPQLNWTARHMDHNWTSLGSSIEGELKPATQLPKGNMILGDKENFQQISYVEVRGG